MNAYSMPDSAPKTTVAAQGPPYRAMLTPPAPELDDHHRHTRPDPADERRHQAIVSMQA